jgi:hypothetical protein
MKRMRNLTLGSLLVALCPAGVLAADGVVALQTADPSCRDDSTAIYVDCGNGTVTDNRTGLVWLKNAGCLDEEADWLTARDFVAGLADMPDGSIPALHDCELSDGSSPGEWRLPSLAEWEAMVGDAVDLGCSPTITSNHPAGITPCWSAGCSTVGLCAFSDVQSDFYWSASSSVEMPSTAWVASLNTGINFTNDFKTSVHYVWPVRGGQ